jgi:uncharacterized protein (DUF2147 family)
MGLKKLCLLALGLFFISYAELNFAADSVSKLKKAVYSPLGYWKTFDPITSKPKSIIHIWKTQDHHLMGKIVEVFPSNGMNNGSTACTHCEGQNYNQPIVGMVIMSGLQLDKAQWVNGQLLDVENGKSYRCMINLTQHGKKLKVRGYSSLPLFGHSQTWARVDL